MAKSVRRYAGRRAVARFIAKADRLARPFDRNPAGNWMDGEPSGAREEKQIVKGVLPKKPELRSETF